MSSRRIRVRYRLILTTMMLSGMMTHALCAQSDMELTSWSRFRGPNGTGLAKEANPPVQFDQDTNLRWSAQIPSGQSSPVVWGDKVFVTGIEGEKFETLCVSLESGQILWRVAGPQVAIEPVFYSSSPATSTPYVDAERVYVYFGSYGLLCYDHDGQDVWKRPIPTPSNIHGTATSPVGYQGLLYLIHDSIDGDSYVLAVDKATGDEVWKASRTVANPNWSTPVIWEKDGAHELIVQGGGMLKGYDPLTGEELWSVGKFGHSIPTPVVGGEYVIASTLSGEDAGHSDRSFQWHNLKKYDANGDGRVHVSEISEDEAITDPDYPEGGFQVRQMVSWFDRDQDQAFSEAEVNGFLDMQNLNVQSRIAAIRPVADASSEDDLVAWNFDRGISHNASSLLYDGKIYMVKDGGVVTCLNAETGEFEYQARAGQGRYWASPIAAGGRLYICSVEGLVSVLQTGGRLKVLAKNDLGEQIAATPAVIGDMLIVRTATHLFAFGELDTK